MNLQLWKTDVSFQGKMFSFGLPDSFPILPHFIWNLSSVNLSVSLSISGAKDCSRFKSFCTIIWSGPYALNTVRIAVNSSTFMSTTYCSEVGILICLHTTAKPLPMMFIRTADTAAGTAVKGDAKCMVARTTPKDEFCIPTCQSHWASVWVQNRTLTQGFQTGFSWGCICNFIAKQI